ncbi:hypothetical protein PENSTE_c005G10196 [Penicillium steckii]|uniref:Uncharacterized protein n=1 Tax=Penicillium steckii TaxID=303698 RepID=A0A1V6TK53_9EURO|nr:hypothetical protein PENSTE_c005G10196 [Penicillium steckii]
MGFSLQKTLVKFMEPHNSNSKDKFLRTTKNEDSSLSSFESISPILPRHELEYQILGLWKRVWLGLYEIDIQESRFHSDRLRTLYHGAGLSLWYDCYQEIDNRLSRRFNRSVPQWDNGIASLKLSDALSTFTLHAIYEVLVEYEYEIGHLHQLYSLLRKRQLGLDGLYGARRSPSQMQALKSEFNQIALPMLEAMTVCDYQMNALNDYLREELDKEKQTGNSVKAEYAYFMAFPERRRGGFSGPSS